MTFFYLSNQYIFRSFRKISCKQGLLYVSRSIEDEAQYIKNKGFYNN